MAITGPRCKSKTGRQNQDRSRLSTNHRLSSRDRSWIATRPRLPLQRNTDERNVKWTLLQKPSYFKTNKDDLCFWIIGGLSLSSSTVQGHCEVKRTKSGIVGGFVSFSSRSSPGIVTTRCLAVIDGVTVTFVSAAD